MIIQQKMAEFHNARAIACDMTPQTFTAFKGVLPFSTENFFKDYDAAFFSRDYLSTSFLARIEHYGSLAMPNDVGAYAHAEELAADATALDYGYLESYRSPFSKYLD